MSVDFWKIERLFELENETMFFAFESAYRLPKPMDLREFTTWLPEGVVVTSPYLIAGKDHIRSVIIQTAEHWVRGISLARNKSIDLLMKVTSQDQISKALRASGIDSCKEVALFGLTNNQEQIETSHNLIKRLGGLRDDTLLDLDFEKVAFLKGFHSLPSWIEKDSIPKLLQEKSALLVFSR
jgi:tRNA threonylcarbamoyladenosine modification (KEOPS) complex Cgi121 subunit